MPIWPRRFLQIFRLPTGRRRSYREFVSLDGFEPLESRQVMAALTWIGPTNGYWDTAANWSGGYVPTAADDVVIDQGGVFSVTVRAGNALSVNSITTGADDSLSITGGSLVVTASSQFGGSVALSGGDFDLQGTATATTDWTISGGNLHHAVISFSNGSRLIESGGTLSGVTINGNLAVRGNGGAGGTLTGVTINGELSVYGNKWVTITNGLTLNGTALQYRSAQDLPGGPVELRFFSRCRSSSSSEAQP